ncbi:MAG: hypothetical protein QOF68_2947 [Gaiellales bacterium]|nr:hypothetical protein [Gaiellales bacterium]
MTWHFRRRVGRFGVLSAAAAVLVAIPASAAPHARSSVQSPFSQIVTLRMALAHPAQAPEFLRPVVDRLSAVRPSGALRSTPPSAAPGILGDVFNHDTVGLPQNEESVGACGANVLEGTNDYRGLIDPQGNFTGWHLSRNGGATVANEGLLPPVQISGTTVPSGGDPVDAFGEGCRAYAASLAYTDQFDQGPNGIAVYRSTPATLGSCPGGPNPSCWPTRRAVATAAPDHFLDKEWMAVGRSGAAGEVVWVTYSDFHCIIPGCGELPFTNQIKAVRCKADLTGCTSPMLISGNQDSLQFSDVTIGPDGRTYITWAEDNFLSSGGQPPSRQWYWLRVAEPGSTHFGPMRLITREDMDLNPLHANDFRVATIPKNEVRMVNGHPRVFFTWDSCRARPLDNICEEPRINLAWSDDAGATWRRSVLSRGGDNYFPSISANLGGSSLAVAYFTNRFDPMFHNRQDVELVAVDPATGQVTIRKRLTGSSNESEGDPLLTGSFIGDYIEVFAAGDQAFVAYNANYRSIKLLGEGFPVPQQDNYLARSGL